MDVRAIKTARRTELAACALAAARNTLGLLHDAEMLAGSGCLARAYSLAALAVDAAAHVMLDAVSDLRDSTAAKHAQRTPRATRTAAPPRRRARTSRLVPR